MTGVTFHEGERGYELRVGALRIPQSTYLLAAAVVVGVAGGYGAIGFRALIGFEAGLAAALTAALRPVLGGFALVVAVGCGGAAAAWFAARFAPEARGHGVPEVMAAVALHGGIMRPRIIAIKALASATTIGFGGAAGREGPIVQIGSAIGSVLGQAAQAPAPIVRTLVACGAAAGISATFNAPIGGVFFASEVILGDFAPRSFAVVVVASVVSAVIGRTAFGNRPSFDASAFVLVSSNELWLYALLGVVCAAAAALFVKLLYACEDGADRIRLPAVVKGFVGFGLVGLIGIVVPQVLGVGYDAMQHVLDGHVPAGRAFVIGALKPVATSLTLAAGGSGGVFAPSLFTGAMLGDAFGRIVHDAFPLWTGPAAAYALVAMAAFFAAAAEAPITAIMIVFEMSSDYTIILPLMVSVVIATLLGRRFLGATIYEQKLLRRGIDWQRVRRPRFLSRISVSTIGRVPPVVAQLHDVIEDVVKRDADAGELAVPVCNGTRFVGVVTSAELASAMSAGAGMQPIHTITHTMTDVLRPDDTVERAATLMAEASTPLLPVVDVDGEHLVGIVTRRDVLQAYRSVVDA